MKPTYVQTNETWIVSWGPKKEADRERLRCANEEVAIAKFREKEKMGMHVDVFKETEVKTLVRLTDSI